MKDYITRLCAKHDLTPSELAGRLGYKSRTSIARIMKGNVRETTLDQFADRVIKTFSPDEKDLAELRTAVRITVIGNEKYSERAEMWRFLSENFNLPEAGNGERFLLDLHGKKTTPAERYGACRELRFHLINSASGVFFADLKELLERHPDMTVEQVVFLPVAASSRVIRYINAIMPLFTAINTPPGPFRSGRTSGSIPAIWCWCAA